MKPNNIQWTIYTISVFLILMLPACCGKATKADNPDYEQAQGIIDDLVAANPGLVRLTIHAIPTGQTNSRIIACNIKKKLGQPSDPEDLEAMKTNKTVVLKEGNNLDVTAPVCNRSGKPIAATGITLELKQGETEAQVVARAKQIAKDLEHAVQSAGRSLW